MREQYDHIAILICVPTREEQGKERKPGVRLFESLTCKGSHGPSEVVYLAPVGVKFSDEEPTVKKVKDTFSSFSRRTKSKSQCIILLHSTFEDNALALKDGWIPVPEVSDLIESLACCQAHIIVHGPGSDKVAGLLTGEGRVLIYSERIDGGEKIHDPFDFSSIFRGDRVYYDLFQDERGRLEKTGFNLIWHAEGPKLILL